MTRLPLISAWLALAGACGDDGTRFPITPGGGGSGSSTLPDGSVGDGAGGTSITGRVCLISDPRAPTSCASTGAGGLTVALASEQATTANDGAFVINQPAGTNLIWRVSGTGIEPSALPLATATTIPVIDSNLYADMLAATMAVVVTGNGAIVAQVSRGGTPTAGISGVASPQPDSEVYYDGASAIDWGIDATGGSGIIWIPSIPTGTASLALDSGTAQATITNIKIFSDTISFVFGAAP